MATAQLEKVKEFLTCTVCYETYSDPCTLMCQHSFCRNCITKYTRTKPEALRTKTIPCPSCRQMTKVPDPTKPVEQWAAQIKPSIIILGLIDTSQPDLSTSGSGRRCNACEKLGETTPATSWCPECEMVLCDRCTKLHQINPGLQDHEICDLSSEFKVRRRRKVMCKEHKKNYIEFHCKDCKTSACQTCCIIHHRACKYVVTIESLRPEMTSELHKNKGIMENHLKRNSTKLRKNKASMSEVSQRKRTIKSQIESVSKTAMAKIRQKEKELIDQLDRLTETQMSQLQADVKSEEIEIQMCRQHCEFIDQALNSESVMDMYDVYQACESGVLNLGDDRDTVHENRQTIAYITFTPDAIRSQRIVDDFQLGEIDVIYRDERSSVNTLLRYDNINVRTREDKKSPYLWDITTLVLNNEEVIIVTDRENNCVKSFYTKNDQWCYSRLSLDSSPQGLSNLKENQVVVTVPFSNQIITVKVCPDLMLLSTLKTSKYYYSVVVLNLRSMAVGCLIHFCVDILNMSGQVVKSVYTHKDVELLSCPFFLCVSNKGNILMSDSGKEFVICLSSEGDVLWRYVPTGDRKLKDTRGITTDTEGNIFLADNAATKVIQLNEKGKFVKEILTAGDDFKEPIGLTCHKPGRLLVCNKKNIKEFIWT